MDLKQRITIDPEQCGGRPCVRGMRIRVMDVLGLLSIGMTAEQVIKQLPDLEPDDVRACLMYAADQADRPHRDVA
jgi:uncharacterized protein (DUF433 family)